MRQRELDGEQDRGASARRARAGPCARGTTAATPASTSARPGRRVCSDARSGIPRAWYCPQPQIENGDSRSSWKAIVRSQNVRSASPRSGSSRRTENASDGRRDERGDERAARPCAGRSPSGYVSQSGTSEQRGELRPARERGRRPRARGRGREQKPQTRSAGIDRVVRVRHQRVRRERDTRPTRTRASLRGGAAEAQRRRARGPSSASRSNAIDVACAAGSSSHLPAQPKAATAGT